MEERYHWLDACRAQVFGELDIVVDTLLVDGVVASAERDDAGPRKREAVGSGTKLLQQCNVFICAVVRVAGHIAGLTTCNLAWDAAKSVPNRVSAAVLCGSTLNLIAIWFSISIWMTLQHHGG